jgi:hypothetical protein
MPVPDDQPEQYRQLLRLIGRNGKGHPVSFKNFGYIHTAQKPE